MGNEAHREGPMWPPGPDKRAGMQACPIKGKVLSHQKESRK